MKGENRKKMAWMYVLLAVLTVIFACLSFRFFKSEIESRITPQVTRAMVQISRLLPQLESNEQAVREAYGSLKSSRDRVFESNETIERREYDGENAETIIEDTLSWMNRVTMLQVGRQGHVVVVSKEDYKILAHPDEQFVGENFYALDKVDVDSIPDISKLKTDWSSDDFHVFFPASFFRQHISLERFNDAVNAGIYGTVVAYEDTYILCGVTLYEVIVSVVIRTFVATLIFFLLAWLFIRYVGFALPWHKDDQREFQSKVIAISVISVTVLLVSVWYYQLMVDVSSDLATMSSHAEVAVENLNTYRKYRNELSNWLDDQYLELGRLAADLVKAKGKENLTRQDLATYAQQLDVKYIYVFDKDGKVMVTNSPYDHFVLSTNSEDQSYAFRALLEGKPYLIQQPQTDDTGENMQYIGISLRDGADLADGFVQIAIDPALRERLLEPINVQTVLDNLVIGLPDYALAIDKDTLRIVATTGLGFENTSIEDIGLDKDSIKSGVNSNFVIDGIDYYASVSESEDLYLMPLARSTDSTGAFVISIKLALYTVASFAALCALSLYFYKNTVRTEGSAHEVDADTTSADAVERKKKGLLYGLKEVLPVPDKEGFDLRWNQRYTTLLEEQSPERRTMHIVHNVVLVFCSVLTIFVLSMASLGITSSNLYGLDGISYVIFGNWQKGINLFAVSFSLFLLCVLYVIRVVLNELLYRIAKISGTKNETVLLLLRNALKYFCAVVFLYLGLEKFGVNTTALWASVGVLSLMVGLGAKDLISDVVAGLFIIFEGTYKIGDLVTVGGWTGRVQEIGIRYTKVNLYSETKIVNNSSIRDVINRSGETARIMLDVPVSCETDLLEVEKLLDHAFPDIASNIPGIIGLPKYDGVIALADSSVNLRIIVFCEGVKKYYAENALRREIKLLFDREHVNMPYNHLVVMDYKDENNTYTFVDKPRRIEASDVTEATETAKTDEGAEAAKNAGTTGEGSIIS